MPAPVRRATKAQEEVVEVKTTKTSPKTVETTDFFENSVELSHSWEETNNSKLSKETLESIDKIRIGQGRFGKQMVFTMKNGKTRVMNLSSFCEDFPVGTIIRPSSVIITELYDEDEDRTIYRASGEAM